MKEAIYYYISEGKNYPIIVSNYTDLKDILFIEELEKERMQCNFKINDVCELYVLIDGVSFTL